MDVRVVGVDIGSVAGRSRFAWASVDGPAWDLVGQGDDPKSAVGVLAEHLGRGGRAALAMESPLAVPVPAVGAESWRELGKARAGEGNRPWSAGAGAGVLATGLAQGAWMLSRLCALVPQVTATTQPGRWADGRATLLLTEAFVSAAGKPVPTAAGQHAADAEAAARGLAERLTGGREAASDVRCAPHRPFNLLAAMALWAGLALPPHELRSDVLVVTARPVAP